MTMGTVNVAAYFSFKSTMEQNRHPVILVILFINNVYLKTRVVLIFMLVSLVLILA